jgi:hypothetical protein
MRCGGRLLRPAFDGGGHVSTYVDAVPVLEVLRKLPLDSD